MNIRKLKYLFKSVSYLPSVIGDIERQYNNLHNLREELEQVETKEEKESKSEEIMISSRKYDYDCEVADYLASKQAEEFNCPQLKDHILFNKTITLTTLSKIVEELNWFHRTIDETQTIAIYFEADEDFPKDIWVVLIIEGDWLKVGGYPVDCNITDERQKLQYLLECNEYNHKTRYIKAYIDDDGTAILERQDYLDSFIPYNILKERVAFAVGATYNFFKERKAFFESVLEVSSDINSSSSKVYDPSDLTSITSTSSFFNEFNIDKFIEKLTEGKKKELKSHDELADFSKSLITKYQGTIHDLAVQTAKSAIMSRNMSHNIGSHVLSYLINDLENIENESLGLNEVAVKKSDIRGIIHIIKYLQERQDFLATIATFNVPYFSPLAFKDAVFDVLNPDLKAIRHNKSSDVTNYLLRNIARSEFPSEQVKISLCENGECVDTSRSSGVNCIRNYVEMFPGGEIGRHAIMSIVENMIRNAAKHEKHDKSLTIFMELCSHSAICYRIYDIDTKKRYQDSIDLSKLDYLLLSYQVNKDAGTLEQIKNSLNDEYVEGENNMLETNKGIKEMRISASWLRGNINEEIYKNANRIPLITVQNARIDDEDVIQFIFGLRRSIPFSIIIEGFNEKEYLREKFKREKFINDVIIYESIQEYIDDPFSNCAEYTIVASNKIKQAVRPYAYNRIVVWPKNQEFPDDTMSIRNESSLIHLNIQSDNLPDIVIRDAKYDEDGNDIYKYSDRITYNEHIKHTEREKNETLKFVYSQHLDSNIDGLVKRLNNNQYPILDFMESVSGNNSTDRLLRSSDLDTYWYNQHLFAMQKKVAIFDERLYDTISKNPHKAILFKLKGIYLFQIDEKTKEIYGMSTSGNYNINEQTPVIGKIIVNGAHVEFILDTKYSDFERFFDYINIHQGILDKLYENLSIKINKEDDEEKEQKEKQIIEVTDNLCKVFSKYEKQDCYVEGFHEGLTIHSGRSKPGKHLMPQHVPFVQYSAIREAVNDCKYSLVTLLDYAKFE